MAFISSMSTFQIDNLPTPPHPQTRKKRIALVAQGGGQRGIFTAGVLDSFLNANFDPFELYIGTSAGALNLSTFIARQPGFAHQFITRFTTQNRFFNLFKYVRNRQDMDLDWAFDASGVTDADKMGLKIAQSVLKNRYAYACATNAKTLEPHFFHMFEEENWVEVLKATCAIPRLYPSTVKIGKHNFVDGAVSAAIPVREAFNRGADVIVVLRTEPEISAQTQVSSARIENLLLQMEKQLPSYLTHLHIDDRLEPLYELHQKLSKRFQEMHSHYKRHSTYPFWNRLKNMMPDPFNRNGGQKIYRLQALSGYNFNLNMIDILTKHYHNYQDSINFMLSPPARINLIQISPSKYLSSNALLSHPKDLEHDYQNGVKVGKIFISRHAQMLNEISSVS